MLPHVQETSEYCAVYTTTLQSAGAAIVFFSYVEQLTPIQIQELGMKARSQTALLKGTSEGDRKLVAIRVREKQD